MKKHLLFTAFFILVLCHSIGSYASKIPQNGHDWHSMPKAEKVAFCSALIFEKEGLGVYPSEKVKLAGHYFAGRINYYYETNSLDNPISDATLWAYPATKKMLESFSTNNKKSVSKQKTKKKKSASKIKKYPKGIGSIKLGDTIETVYKKIKRSEHIKFNDNCEIKGLQDWREILSHSHCDEIRLFGEDFTIEWKFSRVREKLYQINLSTLISMEYPEKIEISKKEVKVFKKQVVQEYSKKYGKPSYSNFNAYPSKNANSYPYVAKWIFPNEVLVEMPVGECEIQFEDSRYRRICFYIQITDQNEISKVKEDEKKSREIKK